MRDRVYTKVYLPFVCFRQMKTFEESAKSQKTVASMIENKKEEPKSNKKKGKAGETINSKYLRVFC